MCCLFGLLDYKGTLALKERQRILRKLSIECEARGTDATGIAYFVNNHLTVQKAPKPAGKLRFRLSGQARCVMGHTRMTTQGNEKQNYNNHPFNGKAGATTFALAHNGVLDNDLQLRVSHHLPATKIETDSYVAAQLLEHFDSVDFDSLRKMAEALEGTFTITVLDERNNLYFVKGNNPMCIVHFPKEGFYLYASTSDILMRALNRLGLAKRKFVELSIQQGDILRIDAQGNVKQSVFNDSHLWRRPGYHWGWEDMWPPFSHPAGFNQKEDYLEELKEAAEYMGYHAQMVEMLYEAGYAFSDIEEMLYDPELLDACFQEVMNENGFASQVLSEY